MTTSKKSPRSKVVRRKAQPAAAARSRDVILDEDDDAAELPGSAPDPLAAEPLSSDEIRQLERGPRGMTEQREAMMESLRKGAEVKLPLDPDEADSLVEASDQHLEVHLRPKRKR